MIVEGYTKPSYNYDMATISFTEQIYLWAKFDTWNKEMKHKLSFLKLNTGGSTCKSFRLTVMQWPLSILTSDTEVLFFTKYHHVVRLLFIINYICRSRKSQNINGDKFIYYGFYTYWRIAWLEHNTIQFM